MVKGGGRVREAVDGKEGGRVREAVDGNKVR